MGIQQKICTKWLKNKFPPVPSEMTEIKGLLLDSLLNELFRFLQLGEIRVRLIPYVEKIAIGLTSSLDVSHLSCRSCQA